MRIIKCHITNFGCYTNKTFDFSDKLNPFCLNNGEGKTTLATFIKAMFYSLEKNTAKSYERKHYTPYSGGEYGGSIEIKIDDHIYRIERTFGDTPSKDKLKIYDENGNEQTTFLSRPLSLLQGEESSTLGELILGINAASFLRCNYISSSDLDFAVNESIKNKIGNIVMDKERENTYEDTCALISNDLRDKIPTKKNENAYPYKIKQLKSDNRNKENEINELNKLEQSIHILYGERDTIKNKLDLIEQKQKELSYKHTQKGKLSTVEQYKKDIEEKTNIINGFSEKYNNDIPSKPDIDSLKENLQKYNECVAIDSNYNITQADISKLEEIKEKIVSDDDYESLMVANSKLSENNNTGMVQIDDLRFDELKNRFDGKSLKNDSELENEFIEYKGLIRDEKGFDETYQAENIDYPSENVLKQIEVEIDKYNNLSKETNDLKSSYKEPSSIVKILLIIFTLGIFLFVLNNKKKAHMNLVNEKENEANLVAKNLNEFFLKYNKNNGSYEFRLAELKDDITNYKSSKNENELKKQKYEELNKKINEKKESLSKYFVLFGYDESNIDSNYIQYKKDLIDYDNLKRDFERNETINKNIKENIDSFNKTIDEIFAKYKISRRTDLSKQLNEIKDNIEFYKKYNPIYTNKKKNDEAIANLESKMISILNAHKISYTDTILTVQNLISDVECWEKAKEAKIELSEKKDIFIKDNKLEGFVAEDVEQEENNLRIEHERVSAELSTKEDEIAQNEESISKREALQDVISANKDLISDYDEKIKIAELASSILKDAHLEMEARFIDPIKNSFISYANKIYNKIGSNVTMNYDYEIKYEVNGKLRESKDLSDGERTIMMLSLRFAILDSMFQNHDSLIILDDPFDSLDATKLEKAKEVIKELSNDWQIIYFTCHNSRAIN